jgi:hypothetical protein
MAKEPIKKVRLEPTAAEKLAEHRLVQAHEHQDRNEKLKTMEITQRDKHHKEAQPVREAQVELQDETNKLLQKVLDELKSKEVEITIEEAEDVKINGKEI